MNIRKILERPYLKYLSWKDNREVKLNRSIVRKHSIRHSISAWDLLLFYLIGLCVITISLAVFVGVFSIFKDIIS